MVPGLPALGRPLRIASPCCGLDLGDDVYACGVPFTVSHVFDLISAYGSILEDLAVQRTGERCRINVGPEAGE